MNRDDAGDLNYELTVSANLQSGKVVRMMTFLVNLVFDIQHSSVSCLAVRISFLSR